MKPPNDLANTLDQVLPPHSTITPIIHDDPVIDAAVQIALGPHPVLTEDRMRAIQTRILAPYRARRRFPVRRIALIAASLILIVGLSAAAAASTRSLPGHPLYPVKRTIEQGQLVFATDQQEADLRLELADRRLDEFETLLDRGEIRVELLVDAGDELNHALDLAGSPDAASDVIALSERQSQLALDARVQTAPDSTQQYQLDLVVYQAAQISTLAQIQFETDPMLTTASADDTILFVMPSQ